MGICSFPFSTTHSRGCLRTSTSVAGSVPNEATYNGSFEAGDVVLHDNNTAQNKQRQPMAAFVFNRGDAFMSARYRFGLEIKFDALGQGEVGAVVDGVGLAAHVGLPGIRTGFPAPTCFLLTTKRAANFSP